MDGRKERRESRLNERRERDVQLERSANSMLWILSGIVLLAVVGVMIFGVPSTPDKQTTRIPQSPTTTGAGTPVPPTGPGSIGLRGAHQP